MNEKTQGDGKGSDVRFRTTLLVIYDILAVNAAYFLALFLRFDASYNSIPQNYLNVYLVTAPVYTVVALLIFWAFKLYSSIWRYASFVELMRLIEANLVTAAVQVIGTILYMRAGTGGVSRMPLSFYVWGALLQLILMGAARFAYRFIHLERARLRAGEGMTNAMLIGAGDAGRMILRDITRTAEIKEKVVCIIDDDPNKQGRYIDGVKVVGRREKISEAVSEYGVKKIYIAIPSADLANRKEILERCTETGCELKQLPGMYQMILGDVKVSDMKDVSVEDLLGREPFEADMSDVYEMINGRVVLITGGGGSIGSELCRQVASHHPKQLLILDVYENNAYDIQLELQEKYPELDLKVLIGSVRDSRKVFQVFEEYRPQIVYHAAAHKHVPLMEDSPCEAIKNNTIGTYKTAYAAMLHGCEHFVLISTDKAVNPTNIMGASKRLCEMIIQSFDKKIKEGKASEIPQLFTHSGIENADKDGTGEIFRNIHTEFVAVRFGNVLGSNGSVIPIFKKQIAKGGPVTVTHPDIIRYFMTIPEAVSLVMLSGAYARGGEIFVLDMGSPVKIVDLARNLIRLSGFKPDVDIKIEFT